MDHFYVTFIVLLCFLEAWKLQFTELFMASIHNRKICSNLMLVLYIYRLLYSHLNTGWRTGECHGVSSCSQSTDGHQPWPWHHMDRGLYGQCGECGIIPFWTSDNTEFTFHKFISNTHFQLCLFDFKAF